MRFELVRGSKGNLMVRVTFEDSSNFHSKDLTWIPTLKETADIFEAVKMAHDFDKLRKAGAINLPDIRQGLSPMIGSQCHSVDRLQKG